MKTVVVPYKDAPTLVDVMVAGLVVPSLAATFLFILVTFLLIVDIWVVTFPGIDCEIGVTSFMSQYADGGQMNNPSQI